MNLSSINEDYNSHLGFEKRQRRREHKGKRKEKEGNKAGKEARRLLQNERTDLKSPKKKH